MKKGPLTDSEESRVKVEGRSKSRNATTGVGTGKEMSSSLRSPEGEHGPVDVLILVLYHSF